MGVKDVLHQYHWPGNIRKLGNILERAAIIPSRLKLRLIDEFNKAHKDLTKTQRTLEDVEREYIIRVLDQVQWKVSGANGAAEILGLDRSTLRARIRKLNIRKP